MNKYVLRVDDVGRRPEDTPEQGTDGDLEYFFQWRDAVGLVGLPVYYGVVPTWITQRGRLELANQLKGEERIAIHGWNHAKHAPVDSSCMAIARLEFHHWDPVLGTSNPCLAYIPPFNWYSADTLKDWKTVGGKYFFGGFPEHYPGTGLRPTIQHGLLYLPAYQPLYGHAWEILRTLDQFKDLASPIPYPVVVTFHVPWDVKSDWGTLSEVVQTISPNLVTLEEVEKGLPYGN